MIYRDVPQFFQALADFIRANPTTPIYPHDNPAEMLVGYRAKLYARGPRLTWEIPLYSIKASPLKTLAVCLSTPEGRQRLLVELERYLHKSQAEAANFWQLLKQDLLV